MRVEINKKLAEQCLRVKVALVALSPLFAYGAEAQIQRHAAESVSGWTWFFVFAFSALGWVVSEVDKVAELWNLDGRTIYERVKVRLVLFKTVAASAFAGVATFFIGKIAPDILLWALGVDAKTRSTPEIPEMLLLLAAAFAGYMGARWFAWMETKITGKVQTP